MKTWQVLWRVLMYRPWLALACLVSWLLISLTPVALGLVARSFFDALAGGAPATAGVWWLAALPLAVQGVRLLVTWISVPLSVAQRFTLNALLSHNVFAHVLSQPGARALPVPRGEAVSRFRDDVDEVATFLSMIRLLSAAGEAVTFAVTLWLMLRINPFITGAAVLPLLAVVWLARQATRWINRYRDRSRAATGQFTTALGEVLAMVQTLKLAGAEGRAAEHVRRLGDRRRAETVRDTLFSEMLRSVFTGAGTLGTGVVLLLAASSMRAGTFTVGDFALFAACLGRVTLFTGTVGELLARYRQTRISLERLLALMPGAPAGALAAHSPLPLERPEAAGSGASLPEAPPADPLQTLDATNLTYLYPESGRGINGADLRLPRGSITVITGRVGSGKTTLLRALLGLLPPQAGEVRWNGQPVADPGAHFQPPRSSYTPQVPILFSATLRENILLGLSEEVAPLTEAVRLAVLDQDLGNMEQGLETPVGPRGVKLSGGQVQRTAAARMLVRAPDLLVFDDLSSALDIETELRLWHQLRQRPDTTCLAVSHRRAALQAADQVVVLKDGRVEAVGRPEQLLAESAEFRAIWEGNAVS
jgi:ATP-binding cassette, subfamily B, bacterial